MDESSGLVPSDPTLVAVESIPALCIQVELEAMGCDEPAFVKELYARMGALAEYASQTSKEGQARLQATRLRLLARIAELTPPAPANQYTKSAFPNVKKSTSEPVLPRDVMTTARKLAADPDAVEDEIGAGTDDRPPTVAGALRRVKAKTRAALSDEEQRRIDHVQAVKRMVNSAYELLTGWTVLPALQDEYWRADVLAGVDEVNRRKLLEIERYYLKGVHNERSTQRGN